MQLGYEKMYETKGVNAGQIKQRLILSQLEMQLSDAEARQGAFATMASFLVMLSLFAFWFLANF